MLKGAYLGLENDLVEAKKQPVPQEVLDAYDANREIIEEVFGREKPRDNFYHGTGKLQYAGDKYTAGTSQELRHPLDTILEQGIQPHLDVWNSTPGGYMSSSLATTWPYAKVYADFHQNTEDPLKWEYGNKADWLSYFMAGTMVAHGKNAIKRGVTSPRSVLDDMRKARKFMKDSKSSDGDMGKLQKWVSYVRRSNPTDRATDLFHAGTDIPDNFGAIFAIDPKGVNIAPKGPGVYEVRTVDLIPPDHFLALAVPLDKVEEYKRKVFQLEHGFPVLPTEAIEYHMSKFSFTEITKKVGLPREFGERYSTDNKGGDIVSGKATAEETGTKHSEVSQTESLVHPRVLPSEALILAHTPKPEWFVDPTRFNGSYHGSDHLMRVFVLQELLAQMLVESGTLQPEQIDREALRWASSLHDIGRESDIIAGNNAEVAATRSQQLIPTDLPDQTREKIRFLIVQHDKPYDPSSPFAAELAILKNADSLDRVRLIRDTGSRAKRLALKFAPTRLKQKVGLDTRYLNFNEAHQLIPLAEELCRISTADESQRKADPIGVVVNAAKHMGILEQTT